MLVELHLDRENIERFKKICKENNLNYNTNPDIFPVEGFYDRYYYYAYKEIQDTSFEDWYEALPIDEPICQYGVADNISQIQKYYKKFIDDPNSKWVIELQRIDQHPGETGGWRWHKWGPYIGDLEPQCEYLDDEDFGPDWQGYVICFHLVRIK